MRKVGLRLVQTIPFRTNPDRQPGLGLRIAVYFGDGIWPHGRISSHYSFIFGLDCSRNRKLEYDRSLRHWTLYPAFQLRQDILSSVFLRGNPRFASKTYLTLWSKWSMCSVGIFQFRDGHYVSQLLKGVRWSRWGRFRNMGWKAWECVCTIHLASHPQGLRMPRERFARNLPSNSHKST